MVHAVLFAVVPEPCFLQFELGDDIRVEAGTWGTSSSTSVMNLPPMRGTRSLHAPIAMIRKLSDPAGGGDVRFFWQLGDVELDAADIVDDVGVCAVVVQPVRVAVLSSRLHKFIHEGEEEKSLASNWEVDHNADKAAQGEGAKDPSLKVSLSFPYEAPVNPSSSGAPLGPDVEEFFYGDDKVRRPRFGISGPVGLSRGRKSGSLGFQTMFDGGSPRFGSWPALAELGRFAFDEDMVLWRRIKMSRAEAGTR